MLRIGMEGKEDSTGSRFYPRGDYLEWSIASYPIMTLCWTTLQLTNGYGRRGGVGIGRVGGNSDTSELSRRPHTCLATQVNQGTIRQHPIIILESRRPTAYEGP